MCDGVSISGSDETDTMTGGGQGQETTTNSDTTQDAIIKAKEKIDQIGNQIGEIPPRGHDILNPAEVTSGIVEGVSDTAELLYETGEEMVEILSDPKGYFEDKYDQVQATQDHLQEAWENTFNPGGSMDEGGDMGGTEAMVTTPSILTENDVNLAIMSPTRRKVNQERALNSLNRASNATLLAPRNMA